MSLRGGRSELLTGAVRSQCSRRLVLVAASRDVVERLQIPFAVPLASNVSRAFPRIRNAARTRLRSRQEVVRVGAMSPSAGDVMRHRCLPRPTA
jgi:hypothetical protein